MFSKFFQYSVQGAPLVAGGNFLLIGEYLSTVGNWRKCMSG
jgi:hypothetical protein